jgi:hypothetical protein
MMGVNLEGAALVRDSISYSWRCILKIIELLKLCVIKRVGVGQAELAVASRLLSMGT